MALLEAARKALNLADDAPEAEVEAQLGKIELAPLKAAVEEVGKLAPFAAIGTAALADQAKAYVDHCRRLGQNEAEAAAVAELFTGKQDYAGLKGLADAKFAEVCERFPATPQGDPNVGRETQPARRERPQEFALV